MLSIAGLALVALGGAIGGMARFWVGALVGRRFGDTFPWGTLVVNVTGAASIGVLAAIFLDREAHAVTSIPLWAWLVAGTLGSYTTVSSFSLQTLALLRSGETMSAALNIVASLALCLTAAAATYIATLFWLGAL